MTEAAIRQQETKKCPACAELVLADAMKCKHCGHRLVPRRLSKTQKIAAGILVALAVAAPFAPKLYRIVAMHRAFYSATRDAKWCCEKAVRAKVAPPNTDEALLWCGQRADVAWADAKLALRGAGARSGGDAGYYTFLALADPDNKQGTRQAVLNHIASEWRVAHAALRGERSKEVDRVAQGLEYCEF